ncbi:ester cyclase [Plantactinospora sp. DSM 117369]
MFADELAVAWLAMCGAGDVARLAELTTADVVCHGPGGAGSRASLTEWLRWYPKTFADQRATVHDVLVPGSDRIVVRYTIESTYRGGFLDLPAAGQAVYETGIIIFRLSAAGLVAEIWFEGNDLQIAVQLGGRVVATGPAAPRRQDREPQRGAEVSGEER